jgi:hypothetical protein
MTGAAHFHSHSWGDAPCWYGCGPSARWPAPTARPDANLGHRPGESRAPHPIRAESLHHLVLHDRIHLTPSASSS